MKLGISSSGVVWRPDRKLQRGLSAYELTCIRNMSVRTLDVRSHQAETGKRLQPLLAGDVCYAFYAKPTSKVKIGRTTDLPARWRRLETGSGMLLQLLSVWHCPDSRQLEADMFDRYNDCRTVGEWFESEPVIADLKRWASQRKWSLNDARFPAMGGKA